MKAAPVIDALKTEGADQLLVHTGQHYDENMSEIFFNQLGLPVPDANLEVGAGGHSHQTAEIMKRFDEWLEGVSAETVVVYGDVNSTVAAGLVCAKRLVPLVHVEAGLRSFDRTMPEEINRLVTDQLASVLFTPSKDGDENLLREGIAPEKIHFVGNVMIDTLVRLSPAAEERWASASASYPDRFALVTLHRPSNVDDPEKLFEILRSLEEVAEVLPLVFPVHPRTRGRLENYSPPPNLHFIDPVGYIDFLGLEMHAAFVVTDSGGVQEETTYLGVPCLTLRPNTERPVTVTDGTNVLLDAPSELSKHVGSIVGATWKEGSVPPLWDGHAGERIAMVISNGV